MTDVVPMVSYADCAAAADWLVRAFGFEEVERMGGDEVTHVTLRAGDGVIFLGKPGGSYVNPTYEGPWVIDGVWVQVDDLEAHYARAEAAGARLLSEIQPGPTGPLYRVEDPFGHRWMFAQR
ncbi:MAG: VOC family protein [Gaiellaceae bacterium]